MKWRGLILPAGLMLATPGCGGDIVHVPADVSSAPVESAAQAERSFPNLHAPVSHVEQQATDPLPSPPIFSVERSPRDPLVRTPAKLRLWLSAMKKQGVNTLVVAVDLYDGDPRRHAWWNRVVAEARHQHLRLLAVLNLRQFGSAAETGKWGDRQFHVYDRTLRPSSSPDLLHPLFQAKVLAACLTLAATGVDGILFRMDPVSGPFDGFTQYALQGFQQDFQSPIHPDRLFPLSRVVEAKMRALHASQPKVEFSETFWRWIGWKNRQYLDVLNRMMARVRQEHPNVTFGLELHSDVMIDPRRALVLYTEDFLEARLRSFDFFVVLDSGEEEPPSAPQTVAQAAIRMADVLDDPSKVLVQLSLDPRTDVKAAYGAGNMKATLGVPGGMGLVVRQK